MCLGVPGRIVELVDGDARSARVDVSGVTRVISVELLEDDEVGPGDWVLIHVGFAMSKIDEDEARATLEALQSMGDAYDDEVEAMRAAGEDGA